MSFYQINHLQRRQSSVRQTSSLTAFLQNFFPAPRLVSPERSKKLEKVDQPLSMSKTELVNTLEMCGLGECEEPLLAEWLYKNSREGT